MRLAFKRIQIFLLISTAFIAAINIFVIYLLFDNQLSKNLAIYNTLGLIIMFIIIQFIIAKHIIKLVKAQYKVKIKAEECIQEKAMLIEKMTKGLALVQVKNQEKQDKDLQYSYIITFANEAFQRIVNSERDQIIGKDLFGIVSLKNKYDIEETLIKLLRSEISSRQSELYIEELNKWLTVSVYSYNEANLAIECDDITQSKLLNEKLIKDDETLLETLDGRLIRIAMKLSPISLNDGEMAGFVLAFRDITERYENQKRIEFLSIHDELTGLYNRHHMEGLIREVDIEKNLPITIMVLDIDNLKLANDIFGHAKGDELIKVASDLFRNVFRKEDFISRTGGDEFSVILPRTNLESAERIKSKIYRDADKYSVEPLISSISVGCAVKSSPEEKIVDVIKSADTNMYQDKQANRRPVMNKMVRKFMTYNRDNVFFVQDHLDKVSFYSKALYKVIGKSDKEVSSFASAVRLHDIGKVVVPKEILNKRGKLTDEEFEIVKGHVQASYQILRVMHEYENYAEAILHHHERVDGTGYPDGLVASEIPLESKVIAITNSYEAMTSVRPYRDAMSKRDAIAELKKGRGSQYDSSLVDIFVNEVL